MLSAHQEGKWFLGSHLGCWWVQWSQWTHSTGSWAARGRGLFAGNSSLKKTRLHNFLVLPKADYFSEVVCSNFLEWVKPTPHDNATWEFEMVETAKASVDEFLGKKLVQWKLENQEQEKECVVKCASVMRKNSGCWFENRPKPRIVARYEGMIEWKNLAQSHSYYLFCVENICTQQQKHIRAEILKEQGWIKALTIKKKHWPGVALSSPWVESQRVSF